MSSDDSHDTAVKDYEEALAYLRGIGRPKNARLAMQLFQDAADKGMIEGLLELGRCHLSNLLSIHLPKKGFTLIQEAAKAGLGAAQYELALCYKEGQGTKRQLKQAQKWLRLAQQQGVAGASDELKLVERWLEHPETIPKPPRNNGMQFYRIAREKGQARIQFYGRCIHQRQWADSEHWGANHYSEKTYRSDDGRFIVEITKKGIRETRCGGGGASYGSVSMRKVRVFTNHKEANHFAQYGFGRCYPDD